MIKVGDVYFRAHCFDLRVCCDDPRCKGCDGPARSRLTVEFDEYVVTDIQKDSTEFVRKWSLTWNDEENDWFKPIAEYFKSRIYNKPRNEFFGKTKEAAALFERAHVNHFLNVAKKGGFKAMARTYGSQLAQLDRFLKRRKAVA